jgi:cystathionine beta-lyase
MKFGTRIIHSGHEIDPYTNGLSIPIYQVSTYKQDSVHHFGKYDYAGPTILLMRLEESIAQLENGTRGSRSLREWPQSLPCFSFLCRRSPCRLRGCVRRDLPRPYHPNRLGIEAFVDTTDLAAIRAAIR